MTRVRSISVDRPARVTLGDVDAGRAGGTGLVVRDDHGNEFVDIAELEFSGAQVVGEDGELATITVALGSTRVATITPAPLTADVDDWAPTDAAEPTLGLDTATFVRASTDGGNFAITGIEAPTEARLAIIGNVGAAGNITLPHEHSGSAAANRILCPGGGNVTLTPDTLVALVYDVASARWRVVGGTGGGASGPVDAEDVGFTPAGTIAATDVQAAIEEVATEAAAALTTVRQRTVALTYLIDGGAATVVTGIRPVVRIPWNCTVTGWHMYADQNGSIDIDVLRTTHADYDMPSTHPVLGDSIIGAGTNMVISASDKAEDTTLDWDDVTLDAGDILAFYVVSATTIRKLSIILDLQPA